MQLSTSLPRKWGLKKTKPFRFLLLKSVVLDWFMVSSCLSWWSFACQTLAVNARNHAKTTKFKSDALETLVILMPEQTPKKKSEKGFPGPLGPGVKKRSKTSRNPERKKINSHFRLFFEFFFGPGAERPGNHPVLPSRLKFWGVKNDTLFRAASIFIIPP